MFVPTTADGITHERSMLRGILMMRIDAAKRDIVGERLRDKGLSRAGSNASHAATPVPPADNSEGFLPVADAKPHGDACCRPTLWRMRTAQQQHVTATLAWSEVDFVLGCGKTGLAGEGVCHDERQLLIMQPHIFARLRQTKGSLDRDDQQFAPRWLHAHRIA